MRDVINKNVTEERSCSSTAERVFRRGCDR